MSTHEGWLTKKKQKRYFILKDGVLYWFTNFHENTGDLASLARGSIKVSTCTIERLPEKLAVELKGPVDTVTLNMKTDEEVQEWYEKLNQESTTAKKQTEQMGRNLKTGWLEKKGQKRFFVLKNDTLAWYLNEQAGQSKGVLDLKQCTIGPVSAQGVFVISAPYLDNAQYKLTAPNGVHEGKAWARAITDAQDAFKQKQQLTTVIESQVAGDITKEGWLEKKGKRRFFKLVNFLLTWYDTDPKSKEGLIMNGSLNLQNCTIAHTNFSFTIKPSVGASYTLKAATAQDAQEWVQVLRRVISRKKEVDTKISFQAASKREGWVTRVQIGKSAVGNMLKQAKAMRKAAAESNQQNRRYLRIDAETADLKYLISDTTSTPKAQMHLAGCTVLQLSDSQFMVRTSHGKDFPFLCENTSEVGEWMQSIQFFINKANDEMEKAVVRHGWLTWESGLTHRADAAQGRLQAISSMATQVLSGEKWVVLTKDHLLLWFSHVVNPTNITTQKASQYCNLANCTIEEKADRKLAFVIVTSKPEKITFTARSEDDYSKWYTAIKAAIEGKTTHSEEETGLVFGVPIEELIAREGEIPKIVKRCVEFIQKHGKEVTGIFRLSGQAGQIKNYADLFDAGEEVTFDGEQDVHVVSGLLKSFLRQMPEPIFPFELYPQFLQASISVELLKACIAKIPPMRLPLIKYLMRFLCEMSMCVSLTSMDVPNIAIVFGPNILRRQEDDPGAAMAETPLVLKANQMMITNYSILFDDSNPLPPPPTSRSTPPAGAPPGPPSDVPSGPPSDVPGPPTDVPTPHSRPTSVLDEIPDDDEDF